MYIENEQNNAWTIQGEVPMFQRLPWEPSLGLCSWLARFVLTYFTLLEQPCLATCLISLVKAGQSLSKVGTASQTYFV